MTSLEENGGLSEDLDHEVGQTGTSVHDAGASDGLGLGSVFVVGGLAGYEVGVDNTSRGVIRLSRPLSKLSCMELTSRNGVHFNHFLDLVAVEFPSAGAHREFGVAGVLVDDGVPDLVEVADAVFGGDVFEVATGVTLRIVRVDEGRSMEGLVNITNIVDDEAEGERFLVLLDGEGLGDLLVVGAFLVVAGVGEPADEVAEGVDVVLLVHLELGEVLNCLAILINIRLVDKVPA